MLTKKQLGNVIDEMGLALGLFMRTALRDRVTDPEQLSRDALVLADASEAHQQFFAAALLSSLAAGLDDGTPRNTPGKER
jgi:hypothetical protein